MAAAGPEAAAAQEGEEDPQGGSQRAAGDQKKKKETFEEVLRDEFGDDPGMTLCRHLCMLDFLPGRTGGYR